MSTVYILSSSRSPEDVRYVGQTSRSCTKRLAEHIVASTSARSSHRHVSRWIAKEIACGFEIVITPIRSGLSVDDALKLEITLIAEYRQQGSSLTNLTDGGEGTWGYVPSTETREKLRQASTGKKHSAETRAKIGAGNRGKTLTQEHIDAMRRAFTGVTHTEDAREKMRKAWRSRPPAKPISEETRNKMRQAKLGKKLTDAHKEAARNGRLRAKARRDAVALANGLTHTKETS